MTRPFDAKLHYYYLNGREFNVIHAVGPNFKTKRFGDADGKAAIGYLTSTYVNVL